MSTDTSNKQGMSDDAAANTGTQAAQSGQALSGQQPNESAEAYAQRQAAYNEAQG